MRKSGGQLSINGVKLFSMTIHKLVMSRTSVYRNISTGSTLGAGTTYRSRAYEFTHGFFVGFVFLTPFTTHGILLVVIKFDNRKTRLAWCNEEKWWTTQYQWSKVIFNDD
jgi:hypothetical protein